MMLVSRRPTRWRLCAPAIHTRPMQSIIETARKMPEPARSILRAVYRASQGRRLAIPRLVRNFVAARGPVYRDDTRVEIQDCGAWRAYVKTFRFPGKYISGFHAQLAGAPLGRMGVPFCIDLGVDGFLARDEAMKLYELAFFAPGDVLGAGHVQGAVDVDHRQGVERPSKRSACHLRHRSRFFRRGGAIRPHISGRRTREFSGG